jgi:hypothetical protein
VGLKPHAFTGRRAGGRPDMFDSAAGGISVQEGWPCLRQTGAFFRG